MNLTSRVDAIAARLARGGDCNPIERHHFEEAVLWADYGTWAEVEKAFHAGDDAEFGRLLRSIALRYWVREANL